VNSLDQVQAVGNWHPEVGEHQVRVLLLEPSETILAVLRRHDAITLYLEKIGQALDEEVVIVNHKDGLHYYGRKSFTRAFRNDRTRVPYSSPEFSSSHS